MSCRTCLSLQAQHVDLVLTCARAHVRDLQSLSMSAPFPTTPLLHLTRASTPDQVERIVIDTYRYRHEGLTDTVHTQTHIAQHTTHRHRHTETPTRITHTHARAHAPRRHSYDSSSTTQAQQCSWFCVLLLLCVCLVCVHGVLCYRNVQHGLNHWGPLQKKQNRFVAHVHTHTHAITVLVNINVHAMHAMYTMCAMDGCTYV